jgi:hypothetical protein
MGHQNADTENYENACYSRQHVYFLAPADKLNGGRDAQSKRITSNEEVPSWLMSLGHTRRADRSIELKAKAK